MSASVRKIFDESIRSQVGLESPLVALREQLSSLFSDINRIWKSNRQPYDLFMSNTDFSIGGVNFIVRKWNSKRHGPYVDEILFEVSVHVGQGGKFYEVTLDPAPYHSDEEDRSILHYPLNEWGIQEVSVKCLEAISPFLSRKDKLDYFRFRSEQEGQSMINWSHGRS